MKSLEIRINSLQDAKSVMQNFQAINNACKDQFLSSIECLVAKEIYHEVQEILAGAFQVKAFYSQIAPRTGNTLFILPPFIEVAPLVVRKKAA